MHITYTQVLAAQAAKERAETERRAALEADTTEDRRSPIAPITPRARQGFQNLGIIDREATA